MFRVGSGKYVARITDAPIVHDGAQCVGLCDEAVETIHLAASLPVEKRLHTLLHELCHGAVFAHGMPRDVESLCDFFASAAELAFRDLATAGGEEALRRLRPGETLGLATGRIGLLRSRSCVCGGMVAAGDVLCERDTSHPDQVTLALYCEHCDQTVTWNELATFGGLPSGVVTGEAKVERGCAIHLSSQPCA